MNKENHNNQPNNREFQKSGSHYEIKRSVLKRHVENRQRQTPFVIPQAPKSIIAQIVDKTLEILNPIDVPFNSKSVISDNGLIATLFFDDHLLKIHEVNGTLINEINNFPYKAIACKQNTVYLGGEYGEETSRQGEVFKLLDLETRNFELKEIELPIKLSEGKAIDDLLILDQELLVVDNLVFPKYLLRYEISNPNDPKHLETIKLPYRRPYEYIIKGDQNQDWLVLFSSSVGRNGASQHLSISGKKDEVISIRRGMREEYYLKDFCVLGNELYILRSDCFGKINLEGEIDMDSFEQIATKKNHWERVLKAPSGNIILLNENGYELVI